MPSPTGVVGSTYRTATDGSTADYRDVVLLALQIALLRGELGTQSSEFLLSKYTGFQSRIPM